jgi:hypothetical protein
MQFFRRHRMRVTLTAERHWSPLPIVPGSASPALRRMLDFQRFPARKRAAVSHPSGRSVFILEKGSEIPPVSA